MAAQRRLGKFTAPNVRSALARKRLFAELDAARERPVVWIAAPAGSGKTTLAASYVAARRRPGLWYRIDPADSDPASFFHHLGEAVQRQHRGGQSALPRLTPELLPGIQAFTRTFARRMFARVRGSTTLVMDNYQELSPDSPVHDLIPLIVEEAPEDFQLMVLSREAPLPAHARLSAHERLAQLGWEDLRFTREEARAFMSSRSLGFEASLADELIRKAQGWIAGLILMGESARRRLHTPQEPALEEAFHYFATEVLRDAAQPLRDFLLKSAFVPEMTGTIASALTGKAQAGQVLADLARRNYFTVRHQDRAAVYQYHPLFRDFLRDTAEREYGVDVCRELSALAARCLEQAGELERAAESYAAVGAWEPLARVLQTVAPSMLAEGRHRILFGWLERTKESALDALPWLRYWRGAAMLMLDPQRAIVELERAYERLLLVRDDLGCCVSWSTIVNALLFLHSMDSLPRWLQARRRFTLPEDAPLAVRAGYVAAAYTAMVSSFPDNPEIRELQERALQIVDGDAPLDARLRIGGTVLLHTTWHGAGRAGERVLARLAPVAASADAPPLAAFIWQTFASQHHYFYSEQPDQRDQIECTEAFVALAREHGMVAMGHLKDICYLQLALERNDMDHAKASAKALSQLDGSLSANDRCLCAYLGAWYCRAAGDLAGSIERAEESRRIAEDDRTPVSAVFTAGMLGMVRAENGRLSEGLSLLATSRRLARRYRILASECIGLSYSALVCLDRNQPARAVRFLEAAMAIAARQRYIRLPGLTRKDYERLCALALEHEIEVEHVRLLVRVKRLAPPAGSVPERWPFPVKLYTLGRAGVLVDEKPLKFAAKAQKKPLELLKALVAFGGREVSEAKLAEALWPDSDGDTAAQALATTLHRLRKLIGERAVERQEGRLSLDACHVWVDAWAFERTITELEAGCRKAELSALERATTRLLGLYRGGFLVNEVDATWALSMRERLRSRFLRGLESASRVLSERDPERAIACYRAALEVEPLAENVHCSLVRCYLSAKRTAEALAAYERCRKLLATQLGISPSQELQALAKQALAG